MNRSIEHLREHAARPDLGFDLIRIFLGTALFVRGALFVASPDRIVEMAGTAGHWLWPAALGHYVGIAHLCGGLLLAAGLATRLAAAMQIPVLFGAVFLVHLREGLLTRNQSLELSALVLAMLVVYAVFGAGELSLDHLVHRGEARGGPRHGGPSRGDSRLARNA